MNTFLLGTIVGLVLVTMLCSILTAIIVVKHTKMEELAKRLLKAFAIILAVFLVVGLAAGVSYIKGDSTTSKNDTITLETAGFNELSIDDYLELIKKDEKSVILVARPTCSYCELFTPILKEAADDMNITINYVNTDEFSNDEWDTFSSSLTYLSEENWGTPLTLIVQNGNVVADNGGYTDLETIKAFFKNNGLGE